MEHRHERISKQIHEEASRFVSGESNRMSLITVTEVDLSQDLKNVVISVSILPKEREAEALGFLMRNAGELRHQLKKNIRLHTIPFITFTLNTETV